MKYILCLLLVLLTSEKGICGERFSEKDIKSPVDYVNPLIDTHKSRWFYFSSTSRSYGMGSLSPDTWVNGRWNSDCYFSPSAVIKDGKLEIELGAEPNKN